MNLEKPIFSTLRHAYLPPKMSAWTQGQMDMWFLAVTSCDVARRMQWRREVDTVWLDSLTTKAAKTQFKHKAYRCICLLKSYNCELSEANYILICPTESRWLFLLRRVLHHHQQVSLYFSALCSVYLYSEPRCSLKTILLYVQDSSCKGIH